MKKFLNDNLTDGEEVFLVSRNDPGPLALPTVLGSKASAQLMRMFRDPRALEAQERSDLVAQLRKDVDLAPDVPEVRVMLGMALSVDLQAQEALEELREAVKQDPNCFIARLKFGELLMGLRVCRQAAEETHKAALLANANHTTHHARRLHDQVRSR